MRCAQILKIRKDICLHISSAHNISLILSWKHMRCILSKKKKKRPILKYNTGMRWNTKLPVLLKKCCRCLMKDFQIRQLVAMHFAARRILLMQGDPTAINSHDNYLHITAKHVKPCNNQLTHQTVAPTDTVWTHFVCNYNQV